MANGTITLFYKYFVPGTNIVSNNEKSKVRG